MSRQTFRDFEILVHDDGSTDGTADIVERSAMSDERIKVVGSSRVGLVRALSGCVEASSASLLARMDGDDLSHPERLARQVELMDRRAEAAVVGCLVEIFPSSTGNAGMRRYERWLNSLVREDDIARNIFVESPLCHPSVTMRREAYELAGGYVDDGCPEDYGLWLRFFERGLVMTKVDEVLFQWRDGPARLSRTDDRYGDERFSALKLRHLLRGPLSNRKEVSIWGAGKIGRKWSRALSGAGVRVASFIDIDPRKIGRRVHGVDIVSPPAHPGAIKSGFVLAAVGVDGARPIIRDRLTGMGLVELRDFVCVA